MKNIFIKGTLTVALGTLLFTSCHDSDFFDPANVAKKYSDNWVKKFGEIDPDQDWNTATRVTVRMSINENALADYHLQLFTANPLYNDDSKIIANHHVTTDAEGKASVTFDIDMLKGQTSLYACRKDVQNRRVVKMIDIVNGQIDVRFGYNETVAKAKTRAAGAVTAQDLYSATYMDCPYTLNEVNYLLENSYDIGNGLNYPNPNNQAADDMMISSMTDANLVINGVNGRYDTSFIPNTFKVTTDVRGLQLFTEVAGGYRDESGTWQGGMPEVGKFKIIIGKNGIFQMADNRGMMTAMDIIVADGGTLDLTVNKIYIGNNARVIVMPGGRIIDKNESRDIYNPGLEMQGDLLYNAGTIDVGVLLLNRGG